MGGYFRCAPRGFFMAANCDLRESASVLASWNMKSQENG